ncbi:hypothetical protein PPL_08256 [Heterostelium album PN500]|uniref:B box-type domain-containing protein n=1 Tax=Heterostelium pallidum (strain ATCC 26659 / Pp 5 / PN500) TaxID=670386 RepID=D3BJ19_HETP5|nr:hypothetical protein PPL_08256 [Heterostelium album PN500]EFA78793.1 hypothetical protein PPL_08256 [Heterostelium album PN500]|eukprot:XP_020430917.1 hypothetical protein PPL_08256 [Heterostelium album PN500]
MTSNCTKHNKTIRYICYKCNELMCSLCMFDHYKQKLDHSTHCEHINQIKHSLNNMFLNNEILDDNINNNNNEDNSSTFINTQLKSIWESLKSTTSRYQSLSATENEVKQHFEQLHQYLIIEEHKLKKDIINDKDTIINQIDNNINHLKYLVNIINTNHKLNNNNTETKDNSQSKISDTTTDYSPTTIMKSITASSSLQSFISDNNQTLFNEHHDPFNYDELIKLHNNDSSSLLLDIIHKYNNQFNKTTEITDNYNFSYILSIKQLDFNQLNSIINQSVKLEKIKSSITTKSNNLLSSVSTKTSNDKASYIFTTHNKKGATLINTTNNNSVEQLELDYDFSSTYQSIVSIGEYIYVFGGENNTNKWMKFSIKSKSIEHIGDIEGIEGDYYISVCYDGQDHIYLVNGCYNNRIDRFNINTMRFERYYQLSDEYGEQVSTMIFKGSLYSIPYGQTNMIKFDLANKTITNHHQIYHEPYTACHDNNGNFFIYNYHNNQVIKYNVEAQQIINLNPIPTKKEGVYLMYHRESSTSSFLYLFSGVGNYKYSIEKDKWKSFLKDDKCLRAWCASTTITN